MFDKVTMSWSSVLMLMIMSVNISMCSRQEKCVTLYPIFYVAVIVPSVGAGIKPSSGAALTFMVSTRPYLHGMWGLRLITSGNLIVPLKDPPLWYVELACHAKRMSVGPFVGSALINEQIEFLQSPYISASAGQMVFRGRVGGTVAGLVRQKEQSD